MIVVLATYAGMFLALGLLYIIATAKPRVRDEELALRRARAKRARKTGLVKHRTRYDARIRRHRAYADRYHNVGERMYPNV